MTATASRQHPFVRLLIYATAYRRRVALAILYSVLGKLFDIMPPVLIGMAVDIVVERQDSLLGRWGVPDLSQQLLILGFITLIVWLLESVFGYLQRIYWRNLAQTMQHDLRVEAYDHVQHLEMAYFEDQSTGGLMSVLNDDINQLERFLDIGANDVVQILTTMIAIGGIFVFIAPSVAWMAAAPIPFIIWGSLRFQKLLAPLYANVREQVGVINHHLSNSLSGIATIKSFTAEDYEAERLRIESAEYVRRNRRAILLGSAFTPLIRMVIVTGFIAITVAGGQLALDGVLEIGAYSVLIFMTQRLLWPLTRLGETFDLYQRAMASTNRVLDLLAIKSSIIDGDLHLPTPEVRGHMWLESVQFAYSDGREIIKGLSLDMPAGDTIAIVGATGAGKSTIIKLLLRYYDVTGGRVMLDGCDLRRLKQADIRKAIGLVSQDVFLFHGTVRENIAYGDPAVPDDLIIEAAKVAEAHEFITELPRGYDTVVGERGQKLSGGQRQRLSIARAVLTDPPILVLDEATSSVDNETEAAIQRSLERIVIGRTTIVIAHRLSTVRNADMIYVLQDGQLYESGRHEDLLLQDGLYASLWARANRRARLGRLDALTRLRQQRVHDYHVADRVRRRETRRPLVHQRIREVLDHQLVMIDRRDDMLDILFALPVPHDCIRRFIGHEARRHGDHACRTLQRVGVLPVSAQAALEMPDHARREFQGARQRFIDTRGPADQRARADARRLLARHEAHEIDAVAADIHQGAPGQRLAQADVRRVADREGEAAVDEPQLADSARRHDLFHLGMLRMKAVHERFRQRNAMPLEGIDDALRLEGIAREGLLAQGRDARRRALDAPFGVHAVGQRNIHRVNIAVREQGFVAAVGARDSVFFGEGLRSLQRAAAYRQDLAVARGMNRRYHAPTDIGRAQNAPTDLLAHWMLRARTISQPF